ncbi:MAG TPA: hypothetical protein VK658_08750 [Chryseolinea sp.]|nr:hypothetical protein [Chryseolinea sp.]
MENVYYFQRYSQKENWATNNTMLLLSRLYHYDRWKFSEVINKILEDDGAEPLDIGINFFQQAKGLKSVPDALISQSSFELLVETKRQDDFTSDQLIRHLDAFKITSSSKVMLALSLNPCDTKIRKEVDDHIRKEKLSITFVSTSFERLTDIIRAILESHEIELLEILEDYLGFCNDSGLIQNKDHTMLVVTSGKSITENLKYNIYYDPDTRVHKLPFKYIGLYDKKNVVAVGRVTKLIYCEYKKGKLVPSISSAPLKLTRDEESRVKATIEETSYYNLKNDTKFFLVDKFIPTKFEKTSWSSMRSKQYFFLNKMEGYSKSFETKQIAEFLKQHTW